MTDMNKFGVWAFYVGLLVSVVAGTLWQTPWLLWALAVLGVIVGLLNVTHKEEMPFLVATIALGVGLSNLVLIFQPVNETAFVASILGNVVIFVGAAAGIVALKALYNITKGV